MKTIITLLSCLFALVSIQGCLPSILDSQEAIENEVVMTEGMIISATNNLGTIKIEAGPGLLRSYTWEGATRSVKMIPRKERWYGKFGIYFPGRGLHWKKHNNIQRGVLEEAQLYFMSIEDTMKFLRHPSRVESTVYTENGLAVTWSKSINPSGGPGGTLFVDVWQVYLNGKKPNMLPGSQNDKMKIEYQ